MGIQSFQLIMIKFIVLAAVCVAATQAAVPARRCGDVMCMMHCKYGFVVDKNGCEVCKCNRCPQVMCAMFCENGFEKNEDGCDICRCRKEKRARKPMCKMFCPFGFNKDDI